MNFLAHASLSGTNELVLVGNFVADAVKGSALQKFPEDMQNGILLHRFIDQFTDQHEIVLRSKIILRPLFRHYAPVIADVYYDHFLARYWNDYFPEIAFGDFVASTYEMLERNHEILPAGSKEMIPLLISQDWLGSYITVKGITRILERMSKRTNFKSGMETAGLELERNYLVYEQHFRDFFPDLKKNSEQILKKLLK